MILTNCKLYTEPVTELSFEVLVAIVVFTSILILIAFISFLVCLRKKFNPKSDKKAKMLESSMTTKFDNSLATKMSDLRVDMSKNG